MNKINIAVDKKIMTPWTPKHINPHFTLLWDKIAKISIFPSQVISFHDFPGKVYTPNWQGMLSKSLKLNDRFNPKCYILDP